MEFNPSRCHCISFTRLRNPTTHFLHTHFIRRHSKNYHQQNIRSHSVGKALMVRTRYKHSKQSKSCPRNDQKKYKCCSYASQVTSLPDTIRPHLEYCSSVWDPHAQTNFNRIETVQLRAARLCFRRYTRRSSPTLWQADLGWFLLSARREQARLILMFKLCRALVNVNSSKPSSQVGLLDQRAFPTHIRIRYLQLSNNATSFLSTQEQ